MPASFRIYYACDTRTIAEEFSAPGLDQALDHAQARRAKLPRGSYFEIWQSMNLLSTSADHIAADVPVRRSSLIA